MVPCSFDMGLYIFALHACMCMCVSVLTLCSLAAVNVTPRSCWMFPPDWTACRHICHFAENSMPDPLLPPLRVCPRLCCKAPCLVARIVLRCVCITFVFSFLAFAVVAFTVIRDPTETHVHVHTSFFILFKGGCSCPRLLKTSLLISTHFCFCSPLKWTWRMCVRGCVHV